MKNVSLIKKIEFRENSGEIYPVTIDIGSAFDRDGITEVYSKIKDKSLLSEDSLVLGENTFTIQVLLENIPKIAKILLDNNLPFYGIYVLYDNFLEINEGDKNE
ncbi:hypothetical protein [Anaerococcus urinomassiliensis]|uniref:hypothetical protein n=1 Tax=Anaerococcus urinomassiliensis TaxID=1745712 RepID=UPI00093EE6B4|nr:hypothetical protein [Anaerococcus urinomassiliensis]